jgi:hypothetical protein
MNIRAVYDLFNNLHHDNLSFIYQGSFNDDITERIIDISEYNILNQLEQTKISNKVSFLLAECFQNVIRHAESTSVKLAKPELTGIFITRNIGKSYYISSANLIENKEIEVLKKKLEAINGMNADDLKKLYMNVLSNEEFNTRGGAGLGLIEMARKSGHKLDFDFEKVDQDYSYFYLQIKLKSPDDVNGIQTIDLKVAKEFHHFMTADNIFIVHKGDFSQHTLIPIFRMIEDNLHNQLEKNSSKKKIFHTLVEILQNVSKHALEHNGVREGIFMMGKKDDKFLVYTGNYIYTNQVEKLTNHLERLKNLNKSELVELYIHTLHQGPSTSKGGAGLGLINTCRDSSEKIEYFFTPVDEEASFYALGVTF